MMKRETQMAKSPSVTKEYKAQQIDFALRYYIPTSPTYDNAYRSAIAANYSDSYAQTITDGDVSWIKTILSDIIGKPTEKRNIVAKAKRNVDKLLDSEDERVKLEMTKTVIKTDPEYSDKLDVTSQGDKLEGLVIIKDANNKS